MKIVTTQRVEIRSCEHFMSFSFASTINPHLSQSFLLVIIIPMISYRKKTIHAFDKKFRSNTLVIANVLITSFISWLLPFIKSTYKKE